MNSLLELPADEHVREEDALPVAVLLEGGVVHDQPGPDVQVPSKVSLKVDLAVKIQQRRPAVISSFGSKWTVEEYSSSIKYLPRKKRIFNDPLEF